MEHPLRGSSADLTTQCISFPRSGHHLLVTMLYSYYSDRHQSITDHTYLSAPNFHYCEFYQHCKQIPCSDPQTTLQKNHDLSLQVIPSKHYNYIIQYRSPLPAIVSWYEFSVLHNEYDLATRDSQAEWQKFALQKIKFWKEWKKKWITSDSYQRALLLSYEELTRSPAESLKKVLAVLHGDVEQIDAELVEKTVQQVDVEDKRDVKEFTYYDPTFFEELTQML